MMSGNSTTQSTFWSAEHLASHSPLPDCGKGWQTLAETSPLHFLEWLTASVPSGYCGKMSPEFCQTKEMRSDNFSQGWQNSGMSMPTGCWTLNISECHSDADVCSLSDVLEDQASIQPKFYLSQKACAGILRRAEKRGKELPEPLEAALRQVADSQPTLSAMEG